MEKNAEQKKQNDRFSKVDLKRFLRNSLLLSLINFVILLALFYYGESNILKVRKEGLEKRIQATLQIEHDLLGNEFDYVISDIAYLKDAYQDYLQTPEGIEYAEKEWTIFSDKKKIYDQIRFLDTKGNEVIRINYGEDGAYPVDKADLQNKADRYYFTESIGLNPGQYYISKLDLNVEQGEVEVPYKPMIRICTPAYNSANVLLGVIVFNYKAENLLQSFERITLADTANHYLLNPSGYWLSSSDTSQEWTFMFPDKQDISFKNLYPEEWEAIQDDQLDSEKHLQYTDNGLFAYIKIRFNEKMINNQTMVEENRFVLQEGEWTLVTHVDRDGADSVVIGASVFKTALFVINKYLLIFILFVGVSFLITYLLCNMRRARKRLLFFSSYDTMTEVYNRRAGLEKLKEKLENKDRRKKPITIMFVDVNGLKQVNDVFGHEAGDGLILAVTKIIKEEIRKEDFVVRMGGDEFLISLCETDEKLAENLWQRIVERFDQINKTEEHPYIISVSHGTAAFDRDKETTMDALIQKADEAMYAEKRKIKKGLQIIRNQ